ncbi:MAG: M15 family metallopeptidase [Candidatus Saccharimonadales bacterium]
MHHLIEIKKHIPSIKVDLPYATTDNISGEILYRVAKAYLVEEVVNALIPIQNELKTHNMSLLVWDAYRPFSVSQILWNSTPKTQHQFVSNPKTGSTHNRGCAVDLTLYDISNERIIDMPSQFDDFSERAFPNYSEASKIALKNRNKLINIMEANNFTVNGYEWWHFDWNNWNSWPILDTPIEEL